MVMPGETLATGAPGTCPDCDVRIKLEVLYSSAGYYIGGMCNCGPYCRESGYFGSKTEAQEALKAQAFGR